MQLDNQAKDFSLLRPFDAEAAKRGEPICNFKGNELWDYAAGPDSEGNLALTTKNYGDFVNPENTPVSVFRMAPLCWCEGKPVYKGDMLYRDGEQVTASHIIVDKYGTYLSFKEHTDWDISGSISKLTWDKPKQVKQAYVVLVRNTKGEVVALPYLEDEEGAKTYENAVDYCQVQWEE